MRKAVGIRAFVEGGRRENKEEKKGKEQERKRQGGTEKGDGGKEEKKVMLKKVDHAREEFSIYLFILDACAHTQTKKGLEEQICAGDERKKERRRDRKRDSGGRRKEVRCYT